MCGLLPENTEEECPTKKFMTPVHLAFLQTIITILMRTIRKSKVSLDETRIGDLRFILA